ncbi:MAG: transcription termination/antitermination protein NusG [Mariprofundales bacterium]
MVKRWYVAQVFSGYEDKVLRQLIDNIAKSSVADDFGELLVPREEIVELKDGKKQTSSRKFFPGYILVEMNMNDESWHVVNKTDHVSGFLGANKKPIAMRPSEVAALKLQIEEGIESPKPKIMFDVGEVVRVIDGPFASFGGVIEEVMADKGRLLVKVSILGRATPVELDYAQVEKD